MHAPMDSPKTIFLNPQDFGGKDVVWAGVGGLFSVFLTSKSDIYLFGEVPFLNNPQYYIKPTVLHSNYYPHIFPKEGSPESSYAVKKVHVYLDRVYAVVYPKSNIEQQKIFVRFFFIF